MSVNIKKMWNTDDVRYFTEDILNRYYLSVGQNQISNEIKSFICKLSSECAGMFSEDDVWSAISLVNKLGCLEDSILRESNVQKFTRVSNPMVNSQIKDEAVDLATNKIIKHVSAGGLDVREYRTECFTIERLMKDIRFGELISTIEYSHDGFDLNQTIDRDEECFLDFGRSNLIVKVKRDICAGEDKKYIRVIIIGEMEKSK